MKMLSWKLGIIMFFVIVVISGCEKDKKDEKVFLQTINGNATYYGQFFHGKKTKSGEIFDMNKMTAAHASFSMGTKVKVTNLENNRSVIVKINDEPGTNRENFIDLSKAAFKKLSDIDSGKIKVRMDVLEWGNLPPASGQVRTGTSQREGK